ncbi:hypothetical protein IFM89_027842, partial [Coptis chinensis]
MKQAHIIMINSDIKDNVVVNSALMDMYFKWSSSCDGYRVFDKSSERNVVTWTSLIFGYGHNGRVDEVIEFFNRMIKEEFKPDYFTFLVVFSACGYGGRFGRAGRLDEAFEFVEKSPCEKHSVVWGALLRVCQIHGCLDLVDVAAKKFFELARENAGKYVVLSNTYTAYGLWKNVDKVTEVMRESG